MVDASSAASTQQIMSARNVALRGRDIMGDVLVVFRVLPEDVDNDLSRLESKIREKLNGVCKINDIKTEEIGFGLKALNVQAIMPDEEGMADRVESILAGIEGVSQVDTKDISLI